MTKCSQEKTEWQHTIRRKQDHNPQMGKI